MIQWESGKSRKHAFEEVAYVAMAARYYARTAAEHLRRPRTVAASCRAHQGRADRHPKGVVGLITPWNYPLAWRSATALRP